MRYQTNYNPTQLNSSYQTLMIGQWRLHYLAYSRASHDPRPPVLFIGGAFQTFRSFSHEVSELLVDHPVILLDLPSQGSNLQLAGELDLEDLADLIAGFISELNLPAVMPVGLSYGSALAALFACRHPNKCQRLLLSGVAAFGRPGARMLLEESLQALEHGDFSSFAQGVVNGLINPLRTQQTGISPTFQKVMLRQLQRLSNSEIQRYKQNSQRLLDFHGFDSHPQCPTLILAGEYDHFTQPWEHAHFAAACANAEFAIIQGADHLAQIERRPSCNQLYLPFLQSIPLPMQCPGATRVQPSELLQLERRQELRTLPLHHQVCLHQVDGHSWPAQLLEVGFFGGVLRCDDIQNLPARGWQLDIQALGPLGILFIHQSTEGAAFIFTHCEAQASQALAHYLQCTEQNRRALTYAHERHAPSPAKSTGANPNL
ncbi:alpha/beta fold hydrolase [Pseudomonas sp. EL_65y_Pfl2_R95]|uniref:alpha/beta fold hydrolase n=1 Tax=Pseudomonas sp. EL_65y_Pfl2_R95 TaxID=3088698 RepID=UPI0030D9FDFD